MRKSPYNYTSVHYHLRSHLQSMVPPAREEEVVLAERESLSRAIRKLGETVSIPTSRLDDTVEDVLRDALGRVPRTTASGLVADISSVDEVSDELYGLTVLGNLESDLREYVVDCLRSFLCNFEDYVDEQEKAHDALVGRLWDEYHDAESSFDLDGAEYDCDGPVYPRKPDIDVFDREAALAARQAEIEELDLDDPEVILSEVNVQPRLLGDMLHEHFENCEYVDDIIDSLDFSELSRDHVVHFLRSVDIFFPDVDILRRGFLADILEDDISHKYLEQMFMIDIDFYISELFRILEQDEDGVALLDAYNTAVDESDSLKLQCHWFYLSQLCLVLVRHLNSPDFEDTEKLAQKIKSKLQVLKAEQDETLNALVKVFPTDEVDHLFYPGRVERDARDGHYPSHDARLPLKPVFYTLEKVARETHAALTKHAGENSSVSKTNVVSAMLSFVVSVEPEQGGGERPRARRFINIPLNFNYSTALASIDEAFDNTDDLERTIGADLELGTRVAGRDVTMPIDQEHAAKQQIHRFLETLNFPEDERSHMRARIDEVGVGQPVCLGYLTAADIAKSTEHRHSERVLNRALKDTENVKAIVTSIRGALSELGVRAGTYTIHSGALLVYSYPNSICDPCSISFLALQNSHEDGFLFSFVEAVNDPEDACQRIRLRTRGFDAANEAQDPDEFGVTVIAGSSQVFAKDAYAKLVANRPEAKFTCREMPYSFSEPGINLFSAARSRGHVFEYTAGSALHQDDQLKVPYGNVAFMSGSKSSKITSQRKQTALEKDVSGVVRSARL